jgi:hypothetical protein
MIACSRAACTRWLICRWVCFIMTLASMQLRVYNNSLHPSR